MKNLLLFLIFSIAFFKCVAQQKIMVINKLEANQKARTYNLPQSVLCKFKNGNNERLLLQKIVGDSLIFEKRYYDNKVYDCLQSNLKSIRFHKNGENLIYVLATASIGFTGILIGGTLISLGYLKSDGGPPAILFLAPFTLINLGLSALIYSAVPRNLPTNKFIIYVK